MILGILSDTHDHADAMAAGVAALRAAGAKFLLHCGDIGGAAMLDHLADLPAAVVWGNNDFDRAALQRHAQDLGLQWCGAFGELTLDGKRIALTHGDDSRLIDRIIKEQRHDYLFVGHSHVKADGRSGCVRTINPGALHRAKEKTVATLDLSSDMLRFITIAV